MLRQLRLLHRLIKCHPDLETHDTATKQAANERLIELQKGGGPSEMYLQQEGHLRSLAEEIALLITVKQQLEDAITVSVAKGLHFAVKTGDGDTVNSSKTSCGGKSGSSSSSSSNADNDTST
jgi:hypothetical protein